ncbi:YiiX/YebB-like N1pC/P60 family cysteine hydrolase [Chromobacterium vaccinii]|uniref:YiiX/YebB-like N1pC/P60 family cysteine hydrolase n=1 Tax=Chromobacterium vaccinii TaxID=1108595 RepID=A0ABV0FH77_9NEIS
MNTTAEAKQGGLKRLNDAVLVPGDIVLTTTTAAISKIIRVATHSDISHAMVYVEDRSVIDATGEGVHARNTQRLFFKEECSVHVLRLQAGISDTQLAAIRTYIRGHIGTQYSAKEAMLTVLGGTREWSKKQFCSRLVAQAFSSAGIQLVSDPNFCSPVDLKSSPLLVSVPSATVMVMADEAASWEGREDVPQRMRDATNAVLGGAREKNPDIQTFDDLHHHLVSHPEHDDDFCRLLETSDYLSIWKIELDKNPWQYDLALMSAASGHQIEEYCWSVLENEEGGPNRYFANRGGYMLFSRQYDIRFFRVMLALYEHLAALHRQRVDVATKWLEENGCLARQASSHFTPHTIEWFAALEQWDPPKAMMARMAIELAGRPDVCSICGDDPACDYCLEEECRPAGGVDTLRLCDDCVQIRRMSGELFIPL